LADSQRSSSKSSARTRREVKGIVKKYTLPLAINPQPTALSSAPAPRSGSFGRRAVGGYRTSRKLPTYSAGMLFRELAHQAGSSSRSAALRQIKCRLTSRCDRVRPRYRRYRRDLVCRKAVRDRMTRGHAAGGGKAGLRHDDAAVGHATGTPRRKAAARRQAAEVGRAAGDRI
jgi:hypothetical protein